METKQKNTIKSFFSLSSDAFGNRWIKWSREKCTLRIHKFSRNDPDKLISNKIVLISIHWYSVNTLYYIHCSFGWFLENLRLKGSVGLKFSSSHGNIPNVGLSKKVNWSREIRFNLFVSPSLWSCRTLLIIYQKLSSFLWQTTRADYCIVRIKVKIHIRNEHLP